MSRLRLRATFLLFVPLIGAFGWSGYELTKPFVQAERSVDLGLMVQPAQVVISADANGRTKPVRLLLLNKSRAAVRIIDVMPRCGCTATDLARGTIIAPGEQAVLSVSGDPPDVGDKTTSIDVMTDVASIGVVHIPVLLRGEPLQVPYMLDAPSNLRLRTSRSEPSTHAFAVKTLEAVGKEPWLRSATVTGAVMTARLKKIDEETGPTNAHVVRIYQFKVTVPALTSDDPLMMAQLKLVTTRTGQTEPGQIGIVCRLVPPIQIIPERLFVRSNDAALGPVERTLVFRADDAAKVGEIKPEVPDVEWLTVGEMQRPLTGSASIHRIPIRVLPDRLPDDAAETTLRFRTDHPDCPTIAVQVHIVGNRRP